MRSPTIAAAMNIVPIGLDYLYLKEYARFGLAFFGGITGLFTGMVLTGLPSLGPWLWARARPPNGCWCGRPWRYRSSSASSP
ncbi:MAG: hypothetical protein QGG34_13760 [SAR202 cluster bacterium]|nr:hypothetical protein [SAR202 cluster bacterium]MDP6302052.1 hypothetical protein [SAR202 cluster bacterium]MDP7105159.1 hypothetical protein [SAR202 cluster bacterium]MDP7223591.1 hypothetical protein [SAR202 cluster bacterium]MDP7412943.1 hypothetical protein [SAR202 cluster bacterium]